MANNRTANSFYIDTQYTATIATVPELTIKNLRVYYVIITTSSATNQLVLGDESTTRLDLRAPAANETALFDFSNFPVIFNNSIRPITLSNCTAMVVFEESRR